MAIPTAALIGSQAAVLIALVVTFFRIRSRRRRQLLFGPGGNGRGGPAGVREPRKPIVPAGAGAAALPIPD